ncbi:MAG: alpha/beta hydrolase [Pseudomonadota bacterium]
MRRRGFLATGLAGLLGGCVAGPIPRLSADEISGRWPAIGRFVTAYGARIHAWDQGTGQPVVLIHGASGNLRDWTFSAGPRLSQRYRTIAFDRPGLGYSDRPQGAGGDPATQARVLMAAAKELGVKRPIVVGHSLGAAVAMAWALADPDGIAGVVTVSGTVMPWSTRPMLAEMIGLDQLLIGVYFDYLQASAAKGGIERFVQRIFRPQSPPPGYTDYVGGPLSLQTKALVANKADIAALNTGLRRMSPDYHRLNLPIEIVSGTEDFIINPDRQPRPLAERLKNRRLTLLPGVGHMAHHVAEDEVIAAIDRIAAVA